LYSLVLPTIRYQLVFQSRINWFFAPEISLVSIQGAASTEPAGHVALVSFESEREIEIDAMLRFFKIVSPKKIEIEAIF
jgi:hypothetical protein